MVKNLCAEANYYFIQTLTNEGWVKHLQVQVTGGVCRVGCLCVVGSEGLTRSFIGGVGANRYSLIVTNAA